MASIALELTPAIVSQKATIHLRPEIDRTGKARWVENTSLEPYVILDMHSAAPRGLRLRVSRGASHKNWKPGEPIARNDPGLRMFFFEGRVPGQAKIQRFRVGDAALGVDAIRMLAKSMIADLTRGQSLPRLKRELKEEKDVSALTVGDIYTRYQEHMRERQKKKVSPGTLNAIADARRRLDEAKLLDVPISAFHEDDLPPVWHTVLKNAAAASPAKRKEQALFKAGVPIPPHLAARVANAGLSATEQTFRWLRAAMRHWLDDHLRRSKADKREPLLTVNPVDALYASENFFRSKIDLERDYRAHGVRNPMSNERLGRLIDELWRRRMAWSGEAAALQRTAADYLLTLLFTGLRREEAAALQWVEVVPEMEREAPHSSWVDVREGVIYLGTTKNRRLHEVAIPPGLLAILRQRHQDRNVWDAKQFPGRSRFVFPARSSKAKAGHYRDSKAILAALREALDMPALAPHDFRRTFGRYAGRLCSDTVVKQLLNHANVADVSRRYTEQELNFFRVEMSRIEQAMLHEASPEVQRDWPR